jgi:NADH:quinone reductase (non-electrogenic)
LRSCNADTRLVLRPLRNTERVLTNSAVEKLLEKEESLGADLKFEDIAAVLAVVYSRVMVDGEIETGA